VRAIALSAIYKASRELGDTFKRKVIDLLGDDDSTVQYSACLAASVLDLSEAADQLLELLDVDDYSQSYFTNIGPAISDAAAVALDKVAPTSKAWRKRFQQSFMERD
jgi:hypothetical protein